MNLSLNDISATAHSAATSLSAAATAVGGGAVGAVTSAAGSLGTVASATSQIQHNLALVEKPVVAAAKGIGRSTMLVRTAAVLSKSLPWVAIGASTISGASVAQQHGAGALFSSRQGRSAVLGAVGGTLLLVPTPVTQVAAAATLGALAVNEFGGLDAIGAASRRTAPASPR
ncbi:MAG: hypothetical protein JWN41_14 [Thermoleophilia bacterium]|nr:hypothetical protein [Thermoleophilia bacterium]